MRIWPPLNTQIKSQLIMFLHIELELHFEDKDFIRDKMLILNNIWYEVIPYSVLVTVQLSPWGRVLDTYRTSSACAL